VDYLVWSIATDGVGLSSKIKISDIDWLKHTLINCLTQQSWDILYIEPSDRSSAKKTDDSYQGERYPR